MKKNILVRLCAQLAFILHFPCIVYSSENTLAVTFAGFGNMIDPVITQKNGSEIMNNKAQSKKQCNQNKEKDNFNTFCFLFAFLIYHDSKKDPITHKHDIIYTKDLVNLLYNPNALDRNCQNASALNVFIQYNYPYHFLEKEYNHGKLFSTLYNNFVSRASDTGCIMLFRCTTPSCFFSDAAKRRDYRDTIVKNTMKMAEKNNTHTINFFSLGGGALEDELRMCVSFLLVNPRLTIKPYFIDKTNVLYEVWESVFYNKEKSFEFNIQSIYNHAQFISRSIIKKNDAEKELNYLRNIINIYVTIEEFSKFIANHFPCATFFRPIINDAVDSFIEKGIFKPEKKELSVVTAIDIVDGKVSLDMILPDYKKLCVHVGSKYTEPEKKVYSLYHEKDYINYDDEDPVLLKIQYDYLKKDIVKTIMK